MATLKPAQIHTLARRAGFSADREEAVIATAIAMAESGGDPRAHNDNPNTRDDSYGLWQINMFGALGPERRRDLGLTRDDELFDPATNARAARHVFKQQTFTAWSVFKSEAYKRHLDAARQAAAGPGVGPTEDDLTTEELLDALGSPEGQAILRRAVNQEVTAVLRAGFAGHAPGLDDEQRTRVRPSQRWLFATIERIRRKLDA
jgi:Lysozyme like domain